MSAGAWNRGKLNGIAKGTFHFTTNGWVEVTEVIDSKNVRIKFIEYPCEVMTTSLDLKRFKIKNPMRPRVKGVGFYGIGPHVASQSDGKKHKHYQAWVNMLARVYKPPVERIKREYENTSVCPEWHNYQNFAEWYCNTMNNLKPADFTWDLDKDLLVPGNRIYSPNTCCIIPRAINALFTDAAFMRGDLPLGVTRHGKSYRPFLNKNGEQKGIGTYPTIADAQRAYWSEKFRVIQETAIRYWQYLPEPLAYRLLLFNWSDALAYYGDDARIWSE